MSSSHVPCDIQEEIIKRLPVKSLIRFRSVCKAWKSLIGSSQFIAAYTQSQHLLIRYNKFGEVKYVSFVDDDTFPQQKFAPTVPRLLKILDAYGSTILGSSHGLLCYYFYRGRQKDMALLWNPSIRKSVSVVIPNVVKEPFSSVLGFGVCPYTGDPKLVKVTYISPCIMKTEGISYIPWQVMVFSLNSKEWTIPSNNLPRKSIAFRWSHTAIGQFIYWLALDWSVEDGVLQNRHKLIMSFDMRTQEFQEVNLPDRLANLLLVDLSISRLRGSLALIEYTEDITGRRVSVWMMEDGDPKSFTKLYTINPPCDATLRQTLGFRKSGEPIIHKKLDGYRSTLVVYDSFSRHFMDLGILANRSSFSVNSYTESLLLLNEEDGIQYLPSLN